jgi:hypothetical protein
MSGLSLVEVLVSGARPYVCTCGCTCGSTCVTCVRESLVYFYRSVRRSPEFFRDQGGFLRSPVRGKLEYVSAVGLFRPSLLPTSPVSATCLGSRLLGVPRSPGAAISYVLRVTGSCGWGGASKLAHDQTVQAHGATVGRFTRAWVSPRLARSVIPSIR